MAEPISIEAVSEFIPSERDIERRHVFVNLLPADLRRIATIKEIVLVNVDRLTAMFFDYLRGIAEAGPLFADPELAARARVLKREHLLAMVGGSYGRAYALQRVELGLLYSKAPLDPRVFLGAFHHLLKAVGELVMETSKVPMAGFEAFMSLKKVAFLDIGIIVDVLVFERERTIREEQAAIRELSSAKARESAELLERNRRTKLATSPSGGHYHRDIRMESGEPLAGRRSEVMSTSRESHRVASRTLDLERRLRVLSAPSRRTAGLRWPREDLRWTRVATLPDPV